MDLHYYDKDAIPRIGQPEVGKIYAAQVSSDWHRVKVTEVRGIDCTCWFMDHGDEDKIPVEDLREIAPKFLDLAPQAVTVELAGLEDYDCTETLLQHLHSSLLSKSLVGKVENRPELQSSHHQKSYLIFVTIIRLVEKKLSCGEISDFYTGICAICGEI